MTGVIRQLQAERYKAKRRHSWAVVTALCLFLLLWNAFNFRNADSRELAQGYSTLFYQLPLFNTILLPLGLSVIASRLCDWEIKGNTLKMLCTLQRKGALYDCKLLIGLGYLFVIALAETVSIAGIGILFRFTQTLEIHMLLLHFLQVFAAGTAIYLLQQTLSLLCENQLAPLGVGLAGSFIGLFSLYFPTQVSRLILWSYFCQFTPLAMDWDRASREISFYPTAFPLGLFLEFLAVIIGMYALGKFLFLRKEI